jgi:hypothetical protein
MNTDTLRAEVESFFDFKGESIALGAPVWNNKVLTGSLIKAPLKMFNRHGLIAGATGTGKTKTLQMLAEQLSHHGVSVLMMDIKGDLSGIAAAGNPDPKIEERMRQIGLPWQPKKFPVELYSLTGKEGTPIRATVSEFGPVLLSKILGLNDTQSGVVSLLFKYADENNLPLLDLEDFRKTLQYICNEGKTEVTAAYGAISGATAGTILRKVIELEQQGAATFFGEPSFDVNDLCRFDDQGNGLISILRCTDIQHRPKFFSTLMLQLLAEIYEHFPEVGDTEKPELVLFIDEAHLLFEEASKPLLDNIESIIKLIRSKGIGVFFITQDPGDVPDKILGQLGMRIQHALRAFTAKDRKSIKLTAENFVPSAYFKTDELLTTLGTGQALVNILNEKGIPCPVMACQLVAPQSRMDILSPQEIAAQLSQSKMSAKYGKAVNRESAHEILSQKILEVSKPQEANPATRTSQRKSSGEKSTFEKVANSAAGRTIIREVTRGFLGVLGLGSSRRRKSLF